MKRFFLILLGSLFLGASLFASESCTINPEEEKQKVEEFKNTMNTLKMNVQKGNFTEAKSILSKAVVLAQKSYAGINTRNQWINANACDRVDMDKIQYNSKGRVSKQDELIMGLKSIVSKSNISTQDIKTAVNYCEFFHDSMEESQEELMQVVQNCQ